MNVQKVDRIQLACFLSIIALALGLVVGCGSDDTGGPPPEATNVLYSGSSVDDAQRYLDFQLILPDPPPELFSLLDITVDAPSGNTESANLSNPVTVSSASLRYGVVGETGSVRVIQSSDSGSTPSAEDMQTALLESDLREPAEPLPEPSQSEVMLSGLTVLKTTIYTPEATPIAIYSWEQDGIRIDVDGFLIDGVTQADIEQLIVAIGQV